MAFWKVIVAAILAFAAIESIFFLLNLDRRVNGEDDDETY